MSTQHGASCGRRIALQLQSQGIVTQEIVSAISQHCGVSRLRAYRIAYGYTLTDVVDLIKRMLRDKGTPSEGLAHQTVSRWENGLDNPTDRYLDALCQLYRSRPDLLGFGRDYTIDADRGSAARQAGNPLVISKSVGDPSFSVIRQSDLDLPQVLYGTSSLEAVEILEQRAEESGYKVYSGIRQSLCPRELSIWRAYKDSCYKASHSMYSGACIALLRGTRALSGFGSRTWLCGRDFQLV